MYYIKSVFRFGVLIYGIYFDVLDVSKWYYGMMILCDIILVFKFVMILR